MFGDQEEMRLTVAVSDGSPLAPSPVAATTSGAPAAGDGVAGTKVRGLGGGLACPLEKVRFSVAAALVNPSRISAVSASACVPSPQRRESSLNV